jgi:hypothetical protein
VCCRWREVEDKIVVDTEDLERCEVVKRPGRFIVRQTFDVPLQIETYEALCNMIKCLFEVP